MFLKYKRNPAPESNSTSLTAAHDKFARAGREFVEINC